jgi:hypothetical protein
VLIFFFFFLNLADVRADNILYINLSSYVVNTGLASGISNFVAQFKFSYPVILTKLHTPQYCGTNNVCKVWIRDSNGNLVAYINNINNFSPVSLNAGRYNFTLDTNGQFLYNYLTVPMPYNFTIKETNETTPDFQLLNFYFTGQRETDAPSYILFDYVEINSSVITTFNYRQTRSTYCEKSLLPNPGIYLNQSLDCPMTLFLGDCSRVENVKGTVKLFSTSLLQNNTGVGCGVIYDARGHEPINYNFEITGVKNAEELRNWINACPDTTYNFIQQNLTPYQNLNSSINPGLTTARAYFIYNNSNYTIGKFYSTFQADCILQLSMNTTKCDKWCDFSTGTLNFNGTLTINGCTNPEYSIPCPTGKCGTWNSCMEAITNTTTDVNIIIQSSTMVSGILSFIFSGSGIWFFVILVSNILLSQFVDEKILLFINSAFIFVAILLGWWSIFTITAILFALVIVFIKRD